MTKEQADAQVIFDTAVDFVASINNCAQQDIKDALEAGDEKCADQLAKVITWGIEARKNFRNGK